MHTDDQTSDRPEAPAPQGAPRTLDAIPVHDPFILARRDDETYYLYTAFDGDRGPVPGHGVLAYTSTDLRDWSGPTVVFEVPEGTWADAAQSPWAPEVHEHGGRFYLFTTLHNGATALPWPADGGQQFLLGSGGVVDEGRRPSARGSVTAVADSPLGPFTLLDAQKPVPPADFMTLDGTLFVDDDDKPWMVYAHEWVQLLDGTFEAVPLSDDLSRAIGDPVHLFRASEGSWLSTQVPGLQTLAPYVSDGCQLRRLASGALTMLWASYRHGPGGSEYVETSATSASGSLFGPWVQNGILVDGNAGHGMVFDGFDGRSYLVLHRGMNTPRVRAEIFEVEDAGDRLQVVADRRDLYTPGS
ncbi:hypothetical protein JOD63_002441 [Microbacterium terrae]|uniref:Extracellular exo-alpha-(1->5)-L-arabinofuranosidase ArbA n=1 Tax=Microbacterium terrae TaxID=69369 RepID=A0A0M2H9Q4_9MICO|nr:glycoside hydrolase family 43 protein [Microbacterium terrae]KJL43322.1 Extracellular exo-alpha-(1->5)-L-arabinofuranosidase ArbA precursor [Microbacterium terrae]MBP1078473.1 hypothetical protein [Microbacterium terrae]GLJ97874.1 glycosyl hydrolase family 43 [Microbacterium terrae]